MADLLGVSRDSVKKIRQGKREPTHEMWERIYRELLNRGSAITQIVEIEFTRRKLYT
jgi:predicted transcriptional regulator